MPGCSSRYLYWQRHSVDWCWRRFHRGSSVPSALFASSALFHLPCSIRSDHLSDDTRTTAFSESLGKRRTSLTITPILPIRTSTPLQWSGAADATRLELMPPLNTLN